MSNSSIFLWEGIKCLEILEDNKNLYCGRREEVLNKAKQAFCNDLDIGDLMCITDFFERFKSIMSDQDKNDLKKQVQSAIEDWYYEVKSGDYSFEEMRSESSNMHEVEKAFDVDEEYSIELDQLADEKEQQEGVCDYDDEEERWNYDKKEEDNISNGELDQMFSRL